MLEKHFVPLFYFKECARCFQLSRLGWKTPTV